MINLFSCLAYIFKAIQFLYLSAFIDLEVDIARSNDCFLVRQMQAESLKLLSSAVISPPC